MGLAPGVRSKVRGGGVRTWVQPRFELPAPRGGGGGGGGGGGNNNIENLGFNFFSELSLVCESTVLVFGTGVRTAKYHYTILSSRGYLYR